MDRQGEALRLAEEILTDIEGRRLKTSEIVLKSGRLARLAGRDDLLEFLALEREGYPHDGSDSEWISKAGRWKKKDDGIAYVAPVTGIEAMQESANAAMAALKGGGNYSGEWASVAGREHDQKISAQASLIASSTSVCGQVTSVIYGMVVEIYHELLFSEMQSSLFGRAQSDVDGALSSAGGNALNKIERISDRLRDGDPESVSQALTTCRRLIDSCADHLFPSRSGIFEVDGQQLAVGQQNVLNRLQAHAFELGVPKGRRTRLRRAVADLYDRCSAGTHADVDVSEARYVFLQTYIVLGELLTLMHEADPDTAPTE